ncbi:uncharacterized protein LOC112555764 [Pomacea canaliculata]|uniref:uncharacterized protein LOC112555764 n=1 Tax=Pomacea canaliculata TaxID=400727 RepID=UPI000D7390C9|nr:uncharacterized protein LOC112555764 [Pomacea canaliculata]XP_025080048.1 uncharacterized protein LOC112555764 [Pomacea canaliculata]XP_025080049.1 uncharacterized protein LOC112555764 [Pomacea canaliculata]XP_025080050.1 uncharacterized protein LOC112555764 [Pomacea canaliculata]
MAESSTCAAGSDVTSDIPTSKSRRSKSRSHKRKQESGNQQQVVYKPPFCVTDENVKTQWKQILFEEMLLYTKRIFPDLQASTYFVPPVLFNNAIYTKPKGDNVVMRNVVIQEETGLSDLCCDSNDFAVRRCLSLLSQEPSSWIQPCVVFTNYSFDNYLVKDLTVPSELQGLVTVAPGNRLNETPTKMAEKQPRPDEGKDQTFGLPLCKARDLFPAWKVDKQRGDFDNLIISRRYGLIVVEIKNIGDQISEAFTDVSGRPQITDIKVFQEKLKKSIGQLNKSETMLRHVLADIAEGVKVTKILAVPNSSRRHLKFVMESDADLCQSFLQCISSSTLEEAVYRCLCADEVPSDRTAAGHGAEVSSPGDYDLLITWWEHVTGSMKSEPIKCNDNKTDMDWTQATPEDHLTMEQYEQIVSRFGGPYSKVPIEYRRRALDEGRTLSDCIHLTGLRFGRDVLRNDQIQILESDDRFVYLTGPPGSGKTLLLGLKAVEWALAGHKVVFLSSSGMGWGSLVSMILFERVREKLRNEIQEKRKRRKGRVTCSSGFSSTDAIDTIDTSQPQHKPLVRQTISDPPDTKVDPQKQIPGIQPRDEISPNTKHTGSREVIADQEESVNVHFIQVSLDTNARELVQSLVEECSEENVGLRFIVDEIPIKKTPELLCENLSKINSMLKKVCFLFQEAYSTGSHKKESDTGRMPQNLEKINQPGDSEKRGIDEIEKKYLAKIEVHLQALDTTLEALKPTCDYQSATLGTPAWRYGHGVAVACQGEIIQYVRRLAAEPVVKVRGLLESVQALLLDASGLLYNALTWMMRHALVEVFTILTSDYANSDVSLWSSGFMPDQNHQGFITKKLTHCVRCPPEVQSILQMIEKDMTVPPKYIYQCDAVIVDPPLPLPCQGPKVKILDHREHLSDVKEITDCSACGENLAAYLFHDLKLGCKQCPLTFEDILIVGTLDIANTDPEILRTLQRQGIPVEFKGNNLTRPPPYPGKACAIGGSAAQGLESKIIVFIPDVCRIPAATSDGVVDELQFRPDVHDWLRSMGRWNRSHLWFVASRALSHLIVFRV